MIDREFTIRFKELEVWDVFIIHCYDYDLCYDQDLEMECFKTGEDKAESIDGRSFYIDKNDKVKIIKTIFYAS